MELILAGVLRRTNKLREDRRSSTQSNAGACNARSRGFFVENVTGENKGYKREVKSIIGKLPIRSSQAQKLELRPHSQLSPYLEACCLRASAECKAHATRTLSYERAAEDVKYATGIEVPKSVQQRLVHRQDFELPQVKSTVEELSVVRGASRASSMVEISASAHKKENHVNGKVIKLYDYITCKQWQLRFKKITSSLIGLTIKPWLRYSPVLGTDMMEAGNIVREFAPQKERREILDWFHRHGESSQSWWFNAKDKYR